MTFTRNLLATILVATVRRHRCGRRVGGAAREPSRRRAGQDAALPRRKPSAGCSSHRRHADGGADRDPAARGKAAAVGRRAGDRSSRWTRRPTRPRRAQPTTRPRLIVFGVLLPLFMGSIDNTILASALPTIGRDLGDVHGLPWLITIYLLAATAAMPLYGKIADIHGRRFGLYVAIALHMAGSLICALAPSIAILISAAPCRGIGGAGLSAIADHRARRRRRAQGSRPLLRLFLDRPTPPPGACGPALGGFIADHLHWSVIFWLNIPLGLIGAPDHLDAAAPAAAQRASAPPRRDRRDPDRDRKRLVHAGAQSRRQDLSMAVGADR